jgi:hypothetical protein
MKTVNIRYFIKKKGTVSNPDPYRGTALENNRFKILMKLLTERLNQKVENLMPDM